jgi:hypothetical protein
VRCACQMHSTDGSGNRGGGGESETGAEEKKKKEGERSS